MHLSAPIHHTYGPHVDRAYLLRTLGQSYMPWKYVRGSAGSALRGALRTRLGGEPILFSSGREAILATLKALKVSAGEEIIVQGYTCVVVPNAIHAAGAVPIYADIDRETLNLDIDGIEALVTPRTRAIICQHTFGIPANGKKLREICDKHHLALIEDMAHVIPDTKVASEIGKYGDALILSFGRDKAISGVSGGAVIARDPYLAKALIELERTALNRSWWEVAKLLEYPSRMYSIVRRLAGVPAVFRPVVKTMNMLGLMTPVLTSKEKKGVMLPILHKLPNACAALALYSLSKLEKLNDHRRMLTLYYIRHGEKHGWPMLKGVSASMSLQKFPLFVLDAKKKRISLKKDNIHLDDGWTNCVICPEGVDLTEASYEAGSDPKAEAASEQIFCLPTHPTMTVYQAERLVRKIDELLTTSKAVAQG